MENTYKQYQNCKNNVKQTRKSIICEYEGKIKISDVKKQEHCAAQHEIYKEQNVEKTTFTSINDIKSVNLKPKFWQKLFWQYGILLTITYLSQEKIKYQKMLKFTIIINYFNIIVGCLLLKKL
jgi:hypothetical protein